jgi:hypothetical protein
MAIVDAAPPAGSTPTPEQLRDMIEKMAAIYEGFYIGSAEIRGVSMNCRRARSASADPRHEAR